MLDESAHSDTRGGLARQLTLWLIAVAEAKSAVDTKRRWGLSWVWELVMRAAQATEVCPHKEVSSVLAITDRMAPEGS